MQSSYVDERTMQIYQVLCKLSSYTSQVFSDVGQLPWTHMLSSDWAKMIEPSCTTSSLCPGLDPLWL